MEAQSNTPGGEIKPPTATPAQPIAGAAAQTTGQTSPAVDVSGVEKSAVYRINPDNTVETLWSSKEENVYDVLALEKQILFSTDQNGRIYGLAPDRRVTLVTETKEGETTRLLPADHSILAATGNMGRIFRLGEGPGPSGSYEAPVHDSGTASRWGSISWRADLPAGCKLAFRTRSGNSAKPDRTWSEWSEPLTDPAGSRISSPNARFIEWKAEMTGTNGATPLLNSVTLAYLPQNSPPVIHSINVITQSVPSSQAARTATAAPSAAYSVTVTDSGDAGPSTSAGTPTQTLSARLHPADHPHLAGRRSRWRSPGLRRLLPRRRRNPVEAAQIRIPRQLPYLRCRRARRRQILFPRDRFRPRIQSAFVRARSATGERAGDDR